MAHHHVIFHHIDFTYEGATTPLLKDINLHCHSGWTGLVGANGSGKSTLLKLAAGLLTPQNGHIEGIESIVYCPQDTEQPPELFEDFLYSYNKTANKLCGLLDIDHDWLYRWETLSYGERKRAQIAVSLWQEPLVLAIDEPTNHLDTHARRLVFNSLKVFNGVGILVSHDRNLLDNLCYQCAFIHPPYIKVRPGGITKGLAQEEADNKAIREQYYNTKKEFTKIQKETQRRRQQAMNAHKERSKKGLAIKDHDARAKKNLARLTNKDGSAGKQLNQMQGRLEQTREKLDGIKVTKEHTLGINMNGAVSQKNVLFTLSSDTINFSNGFSLHYPDLSMKPDDKIMITGPNGTGKSTLVKKIMQHINAADHNVLYIPQEISLIQSQQLLMKIKQLPSSQLGHLMSLISRLGSRPERLLESTTPSPGELRKIMLAEGILNKPYLIVMDEPSNHLDLNSILCMENALRDYPCGLLLISHDQNMVTNLGKINWNIEQVKENNYVLKKILLI